MPAFESDTDFKKQSRGGPTPAGLLEPMPAHATPAGAKTGDPNYMTSLARGLAVIQAFSQSQQLLTISQISAKTGFSRAAVRRCLYTHARLSFAGSDDNRHFYLRPRVLTLGHRFTERTLGRRREASADSAASPARRIFHH